MSYKFGKKMETNGANVNYKYGSMELDDSSTNLAESTTIVVDDDIIKLADIPRDRRWSVLEKFDQRYYCRIRSRKDCMHILNSRCILATIMLGVCVLMGIVFLKTVLLSTSALSTSNHYDFIVIGAGPAGSVLTNKLVKSGAKVLLLEAGGRTQTDVGGTDYFGGRFSRFDIPLMWGAISTCREYHWHGFNIPGIIVAKGLGGGGINNAMLYVRALESDLKRWNLKGWDWETFLETYLSFEDYGNDINENPIPYYHRTGGPVRTTRAPYIDEVAPEFVSAAVQYGIKYTNDFNNPNGREGVGYYDFNIKGGLRDSAAREFLGPLINSDPSLSNFYLELNAVARKILLSPNLISGMESTGRRRLFDMITNPFGKKKSTLTDDRFHHYVTGVEYEQNGVIKTAYLSNPIDSVTNKKFQYGRGVIVAGGAILSPKLLMNSGIGPRDVLEKANIDVKVENPLVGKNLQDHPAVGVTFRLSPALASSYPNVYTEISRWGSYVELVERARNGENISPKDFGVLSSPGISAGAFLVSPYSTDGIPDIQLTVFPTVAEPHLIQQEWRKHSINSTSADILTQSKQMLITVALLNPEARYQITLNESDPIYGAPQISKYPGHVHYLSELDASKLAWGIDQVIQISKTPPLSDLLEEVLSPPSDLESYHNWVHYNHYPNSHWSGSAKMGMNPKESVLDEEMRVWGVKGLFVADASAMPSIPNGNVHSTILAMAAHGADIIIRQATQGIV